MIPKRKVKHDSLIVVSLRKGPKSNTGLSNLKVRAGLDWLQLSFYGRNLPKIERDKLAALRDEAAGGAEPDYIVGGLPFTVQPRGFGVGASHMAFALRGQGLVLAFSTRDKSPEKGGPVMTITAPGGYCTGKDPHKLYDDLKLLARIAGVCFERVGITRVDYHMDVDGRTVNDVVDLIDSGSVVARARRYKVEGNMGGDVETFYIGAAGGSTRLCVYDKVAELLRDPLKAKNYMERWGLTEWPKTCTRYEWRLDSDAVRESHGFRDADAFFGALASVFRYLVEDWYRECSYVDRNNTEKAHITDDWKTITEKAFAFFEGNAVRRRIQKPLPDPDALLKQAAGCLAAACGSLGVLPEDGFNAAEFFAKELSQSCELFRMKVSKTMSRKQQMWGDIFRREDERKRKEAIESVEG